MYVIRVEHAHELSRHFTVASGIHDGAYGAEVEHRGRYHSCVAAALNGTQSTTATSRQPMHYTDKDLMHDLETKDLRDMTWMYCFSSIEQYHAWFNNPVTRRECSSVGRLAVYAISPSRIALGSTQCVADAKHARLVNVLPLDYEGVMPL